MADGARRDPRDVIGAAMVLVGLAFFVVVFVALFPVLTNPAGAYDRWFPRVESVDETETTVEAPATPAVVGPTARFGWEAVPVDDVTPPPFRIVLTSESVAGDVDITSVGWDLGDGTVATGPSVSHDYAAAGSYTVGLLVEDANGERDSIEGSVVVSELGAIVGSTGLVEDALDFERTLDSFGDGITDSLENAVGDVGADITDTLDSALGSLGSAVRGGVVVVLFSLAALAGTLVAWRTARIGVMLLVRDRDIDRHDDRISGADADDEPRRRRGLEAA